VTDLGVAVQSRFATQPVCI